MCNHLVNFKVDLDIDGQANRVEHIDMKHQKIPDHPGLLDSSESVHVWLLQRELKITEKKAGFTPSLSKPIYIVVSSANTTNRYGNRRSYRILPLTVSRLNTPANYILRKAISWAKKVVSVFALYA